MTKKVEASYLAISLVSVTGIASLKSFLSRSNSWKTSKGIWSDEKVRLILLLLSKVLLLSIELLSIRKISFYYSR